MKFNKAIQETASLEYSSTNGFQTGKSNHPKFPGLENTIIKSIESAFAENQKLREMYGLLDNIQDIEVTINDSIVDIYTHPENGLKKILGHYPISYVSKYHKNPKGMASFLMMNYKDLLHKQ